MEERLQVNPTRMELTKLKAREKTAVRGHKLLKDKSDEMVRQFMSYIKENKKLREEVESSLSTITKDFLLAKAISDDTAINEILSMPVNSFKLGLLSKNIMSVNVPKIEIDKEQKEGLLYSLNSTTFEMDSVINKLNELSEKLIKLAEIEKICNMLANEIEKNRRRVNALEYVMIPQIQNTKKYISMKLDENERGNIVRLMKVKDIISKRN